MLTAIFSFIGKFKGIEMNADDKLRLLYLAKGSLEVYLRAHLKDYRSIDEKTAHVAGSIAAYNVWRSWKAICDFINTHKKEGVKVSKLSAHNRLLIIDYIRETHNLINPRFMRVSKDGAVTCMVDIMPSTNSPGRIFVGWVSELLVFAKAHHQV